MTITLTNLSNKLYETSRIALNQSAVKHGITQVKSYDFNDITNTDFFKKNEVILSQPKGLGYWLWKPYIILEAMATLAENDIVIYSDCGIEIIDSLDPLIEICLEEQPVLLFGNANEINATWTKRDCFILMDCDEEQAWYGPHADASFAIFKKCDYAIKFLKDWLTFGSNENIITDIPNIHKNNLEIFREHRWDQSILSLLAYKYKINYYRMPSQFGNHYKAYRHRKEKEFNCINQSDQKQVNYYATVPYYNSNYGQLLDHHRVKAADIEINAKADDKYKTSGRVWMEKVRNLMNI